MQVDDGIRLVCIDVCQTATVEDIHFNRVICDCSDFVVSACTEYRLSWCISYYSVSVTTM